jgi:hypothetical protein
MKFIKPTYTVVFADKENIFKYRNKLIDPFNSNNFQTKEDNIESVLRNSELFNKRANSNRHNTSSSKQKVEKKQINNYTHVNNSPKKFEYLNKTKKISSIKSPQKSLQEKKSTFEIDNIINWLEDLNIIKTDSIQLDDIPAVCSSGIMLADIINRLEGVRLIFI